MCKLSMTAWSSTTSRQFLPSLVTRSNASSELDKKLYTMTGLTRPKGCWKAMSTAPADTRLKDQAYPLMAKAAQNLLSGHVTSAAAERNRSAWGRQFRGQSG